MAIIWPLSSLISNPYYALLLFTMSALVGFAMIYLLTKRNRIPRADQRAATMSPDTVSSLFPDRPIRPLPKRRLRERLSPEVASAIKYPPSAQDTTPLFYYPSYSTKDETNPSSVESTSPIDHSRPHETGRNYTPRPGGYPAGEGEEEQAALRSTLVTRAAPDILSRSANQAAKSDQPRHADPLPPPSTTSSADGYDSFENTNNKKKRKIPSAGDSTLNSTHTLNSDLSSLAASGSHSSAADMSVARSYATSTGYSTSGALMSSTQGMSGSGRGRLGRSRNGRSPLRALSDGNSSWVPRTPKSLPPQWAQPGMQSVPSSCSQFGHVTGRYSG